ncbi:MAG: hypothetical protein J3K34DRAFT_11810 [Monoraphidium minutum]|nr:MAG: hypothetical protein J3K34DRAFT_11810 [Monoraphidium minutum]
MSRLLRHAFTPIPERRAKHFSPPKTRNARTAAKARTPPHRRGSSAAAGARLHQVLAPKIAKAPRSTKPLTLPEDFELATTRRAARGAKAGDQAPAPSPFKSMAEKVLNFQAKTPPRFRAQPKAAAGSAGGGTSAGGSRPASAGRARGPYASQFTEAKTPLLWTSTRSRPRRFKTREEEEAEEMQAAFHARPVDASVLSGAHATARKAPDTAKRPTEPKPFSFASDQRAQSRSRGRASVADGHGEGLAGGSGGGARGGGGGGGAQTRGRAAQMRMGGGRSILDGGILGGHSGAAAAGPHRPVSAARERPASAPRGRPSLTIPKSPMLRTKIRHHSPPPQREAPKTEFKARPAPTFDSFGSKAVPYVAPKEVTHPAPFHLMTDDRHRQHEAAAQARLDAQRRTEERQRRVSARPLPLTTDMPAVPPRPAPRELTMPAPYRLRSEARHAEAVAHQQEELAREEEGRRRAAEFKARPVWAGRPFAVHESDAPLTVPDDVALATEGRAGERGEFDCAVAEKMRAQEEERRRQEELKRQRDEEDAREYRRSLRFKARPMPKFDQPFFSQPSDKPLTNAHSPNFASNKRARRE